MSSIYKKIVIVSFSLLIYPELLASASAHGSDLHINWWGFDSHAPAVGWLFVDFLIFLAIIFFLARRPLMEILRQRSLDIKNAIEEARKAQQAAEERAAELEKRLKDLDSEIKTLEADIKASGEKERDKLKQEGELTSKRILQDASSQIEHELFKVRNSLKEQTVELSMELAQKLLKEKLSDEEHKKINLSFLEELRASKNKEVS